MKKVPACNIVYYFTAYQDHLAVMSLQLSYERKRKNKDFCIAPIQFTLAIEITIFALNIWIFRTSLTL